MNGLSTEPLDPATAFDGLFKDGAAFNEKVKLLWIGMGTEEPNPFSGAIGAFRAMFDKAVTSTSTSLRPALLTSGSRGEEI
jgi:hypothetical protein